MFTGRETEINKLNELYNSGKFEFAVIYGRRRVGKTTLIKEFIKDKKSIYFLSREANGNIKLIAEADSCDNVRLIKLSDMA